ncbi:MAG: lytic transglycosylase domain-containing protein, partial [Deltaproteobacteria bacterium]|nr:lytic transglycosylase domain-containing protein [Deltaproteobacteria bacterium]
HPRSYYAVRALEHLSSSFEKKAFREWWSPRRYRIRWHKETFSMGLSTLLQRIEELYAVGLDEDAQIEGRRLRAVSGMILPFEPKRIRRKKEGYSFKVYTLKNETLDYPLPYGKFLFKRADEFDLDVDPLFLYAMMRQESHYREDVVSPAGAIGLLQIMPATGRRLAKEADWSDYRPDWLYDPLTNIELSLHYVGTLSRRFYEKWYLIAAAYNAGEKVIERWLPYRKESEEEELIEMIPYDETRDYVKKIYRNYKAYRWIYK